MLAHALAEHNDLVVITVSDKYEQWMDGNIRVRSIGSPNIYWDYWKPNNALSKMIWHLLENFNPRAFLRISKEIRAERPDIVVTVSIENTNVATWLAARLRGIPVAHFIYSYFVLCWRGSMFHHRTNCQSQCSTCKLVTTGRRWLSSCVDLVTAEAEPTLAIHREHGYFRNAVQFVAPAMLPQLPSLRSSSNRADEPLRIGYLGVLTYNKGIHIIAAAARKLPDPDLIAITIAGNGEPSYQAELAEEFAGLPVTFAGWVAPQDFFQTVDVLVVPSIWREPFGRVCIEALAAGVPVIASNIGGLPATITDGRNGYLFRPGDAAHLAKIMKSLIDDPSQLQMLRTSCVTDATQYLGHRVGPIIQKQLEALLERAPHGMTARS